MSDNQSTLVPPEIESSADDHLDRLLPLTVEEPWYRSFVDNFKETFNPPKLPPLELTSKPVAVKSIWGMYRPEKKNWGYSAAVVLAILVLLGTVFSTKAVQDKMREMTTLGGSHCTLCPGIEAESEHFCGRRRRRRSFSHSGQPWQASQDRVEAIRSARGDRA